MSTDTRLANRADPTTNGSEPSLGPLFTQLAQDSSVLIRQEIALAKAEVKESVSQTANAAVKLGIAVALAAVAGLVLTAFMILLLGELLDNYWLAALIIGGIYAIVGGILAVTGVRRLRQVQMAPQETLETLKDDRDWVRSEVQGLKQELKG